MSSIAKIIDISSESSKSWEDATKTGLEKVAKTVKNIQGAWVSDMKVCTKPDGKITAWRVNLRISFIVD
jgi:dodecin